MSASAETSSLAGKPGFVAAVSEAECISKLFGGRAVIADTVGVVAKTKSASKVQAVEDGGIETAYGGFLATIQKRTRVADKVTSILSAGKKLAPQTVSTLHGWLESRHDAAACATALEFADQWLARDGAFDADVKQLYDNRDILEKRSMWIVVADGFGEGSDVAGLHHVLAGGEDINVLVLASDPAHGAGADQAAARARRDLGLYALNYGASYVASTAPTVNPAQFESALKEADAFKGPSVVLAYVPVRADHEAEDAAAAVAAGEWPLYRWDPAVDAAGGNGFTIDSEKLKEGLKEFLDRNTHLSMLTRAEPQLPASLTSSLESEAGARVAAGEAGLKASFDRLMGALTLPPLVVLYGSDGGNAEAVAKRLAVEARGKGFKDVSVKIMDSYPLEQLHAAPVALFVVSTAGQGEFPSNARTFWKGLSTSAPGAVDYSSTHFAVFGLGDSNYWPRKEQRIFFNKSSADLQEKLEQLGAKPLVERGVGDDQSPGGFNADFKRWLPELWTSLGVGSPADANADVPRVRGNEDIKKTSNFLRGTILQGLSDTTTGALTYEDTQLTKFHGIYQQDDRDLRGERKRRGLEPAYSFMVRVRIPGGSCTPTQYLALDKVADTHANGTIRATTRQAVQFHGIIKGLLKPGIAAINRTLMDTLAACGDVNRNVMCTVNPAESRLHAATLEFSKKLSAHLSPRTSAYAEIWLDENLVAGGSVDVEPIYGKEYLPRKFKIGVAVPPSNDVDIYTQDLSFVAIPDETGVNLAGFTVVVGGGMGMTHNNSKTFPCLAQDLCFVTPEQAVALSEAVVTTQRDYGDRTNRKHARMKYTVDDRGIEWMRKEVQSRLPFQLQDPRPYSFDNNSDPIGWTRNKHNDTWSYTLFIQNGRIKDIAGKDGDASSGYRLKSGLVAIAKHMESIGRGDFIFTANQNVMLAGIPSGKGGKDTVASLLAEYGIENTRMSGLRLNSMACVALPTCALALAESERYLPSLVGRLEESLEEAGLHSEAITIRMTGCPNGCARPFVAEIGLVGRSPGIYNLYLGAGHSGERLNKLYKEGADEETIVSSLAPLFKRFAVEKTAKEHFGDWCVRAGVVKATTAGRNFHDL